VGPWRDVVITASLIQSGGIQNPACGCEPPSRRAWEPMKLRTQLVVIALLRVILNTMHRMVYPFLTVFAAGLGVNVTEMSLALTGRNAVGIFGPILAPISDVRGRKVGMLSGIVFFTLGVGLVAVRPSLITFSAALVLAILSKSMFDPRREGRPSPSPKWPGRWRLSWGCPPWAC
jgi:hypothetical protein